MTFFYNQTGVFFNRIWTYHFCILCNISFLFFTIWLMTALESLITRRSICTHLFSNLVSGSVRVHDPWEIYQRTPTATDITVRDTYRYSLYNRPILSTLSLRTNITNKFINLVTKLCRLQWVWKTSPMVIFQVSLDYWYLYGLWSILLSKIKYMNGPIIYKCKLDSSLVKRNMSTSLGEQEVAITTYDAEVAYQFPNLFH